MSLAWCKLIVNKIKIIITILDSSSLNYQYDYIIAEKYTD